MAESKPMIEEWLKNNSYYNYERKVPESKPKFGELLKSDYHCPKCNGTMFISGTNCLCCNICKAVISNQYVGRNMVYRRS